jgi:hypothetical protein
MQLSLFDSLIGLVLGIWATLVGYGAVTWSDDPVKNAKTLQRFGLWFKILGPALAVWNGVNIVRSFP